MGCDPFEKSLYPKIFTLQFILVAKLVIKSWQKLFYDWGLTQHEELYKRVTTLGILRTAYLVGCEANFTYDL